MDQEETYQRDKDRHCEMNELQVRFEIPKERAQILAGAITPETTTELQMRSDVNLSTDEKGLTITIKSKDLHAMRAAVNTYLRWVLMCDSLIKSTTPP